MDGENAVATDTVTLYFECGCFVVYYPDGVRLRGGLACCVKHEVAYQRIENIIPLVLTGVRFEDADTVMSNK